MSDTGERLDRITSLGGCLVRGTAGAFAGLYLLLCLVTVAGGTAGGRSHLPFFLTMIFAAGVCAWAALTTRRFVVWALIATGLSLALTVYAALVRPPIGNPSMLLELSGLLVVVTRVIWQLPRERLVPMTVLVGGAIVIIPFRGSAISLLLFSAPLAVLVAIAIGAGLWLRAIDARRARALTAARRDERLELARDLHDFVAHHITGIVVQAQAARFTAGSAAPRSPEQLDAMFAGIEKAGTEALTSMRRMVGLLREAQDNRDAGAAGSATRPVGDLARVEELVAGFGSPPASLDIAGDLGELPPEVATSVHRIVQEALTNARKHAADATAVRVRVGRTAEGVEVTVRDDGQGRGRRLPSGAFGLVGLGERVEALGGRIHAGPRPEGGWEVVAVLPGGRSLPQSGP
ncbi:histidine kinase [Spirillospora sp. NPDC047279]|uniref:sensor histidine kinase n=1 Tax=Spirillospora sp. NPDC047279 TaxID=3155478 RepID=UPI0033EF094D